jgi:hypothetical protein
MVRARWLARVVPALAVGAVLGLWSAGCGTERVTPPTQDGRVCFQDSDCVPDGCCGEATSAIHVQDAPDCSQVECSGECPETQVNCGCGIPVCSGSHCTVAVTTGPGCPGVRR